VLVRSVVHLRPEGLSELPTIRVTNQAARPTRPGDIAITVVWAIIALLLMKAFFKPNPRPDFQEGWGYFSVVLILGALVLGALVLYLRA
jgi:hypothetical protein